ncbi:hypothetical protein JCM10908_003096 [Rhodotorula pacifica]|uniref:uncharacterized protein n=1 Tax=Rhodotorula pacifica TaxID=1495444 RepID=UPI00316CC5D5
MPLVRLLSFLAVFGFVLVHAAQSTAGVTLAVSPRQSNVRLPRHTAPLNERAKARTEPEKLPIEDRRAREKRAGASSPTFTSDMGDSLLDFWDQLMNLLGSAATCPVQCGEIILATGRCGIVAAASVSITAAVSCMCGDTGDAVATCANCVAADTSSGNVTFDSIYDAMGTVCNLVGLPMDSSSQALTHTGAMGVGSKTGVASSSTSPAVVAGTTATATDTDSSPEITRSMVNTDIVPFTMGPDGQPSMMDMYTIPSTFSLPSVASLAVTSGSQTSIQTVTVTHEVTTSSSTSSAPAETSAAPSAPASASAQAQQNPSSGAIRTAAYAYNVLYAALAVLLSAGLSL